MLGIVVSAEAARRSARVAGSGSGARPAPGPAPPRGAACRPGSTDVSLGRAAALRNRQRRLIRRGAEPKRKLEPEQTPPWRVSPSGRLAVPGPARPLARPGVHAPAGRPPGPRRALPALGPPPGPRLPRPGLSPPGSSLYWARGSPGRAAGFCALTPFLLLLPSKSSFWKSSSPSVSSCRKFRSRRER